MKHLALLGLVLSLAACSAPRAGVYRAKGGDVSGAVATDVGPLTVGINSAGAGQVRTKLGWLSIGAGF